MKKYLSLSLAAMMLMSTMSAATAIEVPSYMNYRNQIEDAEPILEWLEEAHAHSVEAVTFRNTRNILEKKYEKLSK